MKILSMRFGRRLLLLSLSRSRPVFCFEFFSSKFDFPIKLLRENKLEFRICIIILWFCKTNQVYFKRDRGCLEVFNGWRFRFSLFSRAIWGIWRFFTLEWLFIFLCTSMNFFNNFLFFRFLFAGKTTKIEMW